MMAHSLLCSGVAPLQAAAVLTAGSRGKESGSACRGAWAPYLEKHRRHSPFQAQLAQPCKICASARPGGQAPGRGRRGRGKPAGRGSRGHDVGGQGGRAGGRKEGLRDTPTPSQPYTSAEGVDVLEGGATVLTAEREPLEEEGAESGGASSNGHPVAEGASPAEASSTFPGLDSGSESESEESLRADWERLEREAAQRLLALQTRQAAQAPGRSPEEQEEDKAEPEDSWRSRDRGLEDLDTAAGLGPEEGSSATREWPATEAAAPGSQEGGLPESGPLEVQRPAPPVAAEGGEPKVEREQRAAQLRALAQAYALDRMFFYPERVTAGGEVEVFLNRGVSTLAGKGEIELLGSFNDWQYQQLGVRLERSGELGEPWWTCTLRVPREAYKLDFVFHSGEVYENNEGQDFFVAVDGGLDAASFAAWVAQQQREEQRRRLAEKEAAQRAERERLRGEEERAQDGRDREAAAAAADAVRSALSASLAVAAPRVPSVFFTDPEPIPAGGCVRLVYNRSYRPLCFAGEVWVHAGYNGWQDGVSTVAQLAPEASVRDDGDWYSVELAVPADALTLDWVLADAPPERAQYYDNNDLRDFHAPVARAEGLEAYLARLEDETYARIRAERAQREQDRAQRAARRAALRAEVAARTAAQFQAAQSAVLYTEPAPLQAGQQGSVYYNPGATVLAGRSEVWIRGGFNRWTHRDGTWGPIRMEPTADGHHLRAAVAVPAEAYVLDCVFSERGDGDGGLYDNKAGLDYHVPVAGSTAQPPPLHVVHIALEMAPIAKVGGLGDVVTSLARAVEEAGHTVEVILPKYNNLDYSQVHLLEETESFAFGSTTIRTWQGKVEGLLVRFIEPENGMFWVGTIYGRRDDGPRFEFFCHAALEYLRQTKQNPDILHCHDWSSAPAAWMYWDMYHANGMPNPRVVFTIHNLEFGIPQIGRAMAAANKATTVSPTYAWEVSGHGAIAPHIGKFHGIRNGIDADIWDPLGDDFLPMPYSAAEVVAGKAAAKAELQRRLGLVEDPGRPVVGFITRLTAQKGIHLIKHAIWRSLDRGAQVVLLGSAPDPRVHNEFAGLAGQLQARYGGHARLWLGYDEPLSHLIYAGSDVICVPSMFEPCGLTQMVAMRYGAVPVVRKTGGLADTVFDLDHDRERASREGLQPNGYSFEGTDAAAVDYAINRALDHWYNDRASWNALARTVMEQDWSWNRPALDYLELYYGARK